MDYIIIFGWAFSRFLVPLYLFGRIYFEVFPVYGNYYFAHQLVWNDRITPEKRNIYIVIFALSSIVSFYSINMESNISTTELWSMLSSGLIFQTALVYAFELKVHQKGTFKENIQYEIEQIKNSFLIHKNNTEQELKNIVNNIVFLVKKSNKIMDDIRIIERSLHLEVDTIKQEIENTNTKDNELEENLLTLKTFFTTKIESLDQEVSVLNKITDQKIKARIEKKISFEDSLKMIVTQEEAFLIYEKYISTHKKLIIYFIPKLSNISFKCFFNDEKSVKASNESH